MNHNDYWEQIDRETRRGGVRLGVWILVAVIFFSILGAVIWGVRVLTSDLRGQGNALQQKNSATNRIAAQERFEVLYQEILAADRRIDVLADALARAPKSHVAQTNHTGAVTYCISVVADYNAEARKYTAEDFRAVDLPARIDDLDTTTDCKENDR